jgi:release factor glutamine methyltransferase
MNDVRAALGEAARWLGAISDTARLDAELLMAHALGVSREVMLLGRLDNKVPEAFGRLLDRRLRHEPIAYIIGTRDFWSITLSVSPEVLIPRPDSETLIEAAVAYFGKVGPKRVLDLGTGSGALLLAALSEWPEASGVGADASEAALNVAKANARQLGLADRAAFCLGDWGQGLTERFDLILCNPPYVESTATLASEVHDYEPHAALFAGHDGLADYCRLMPQFKALMAPLAIVVLEIGADQANDVRALAREAGLAATLYKDLANRDRCLMIQHQ